MKERNKINKPIFIIGCPRSGTGIFHQLLRLHPDIAWITPVTNRCFSLKYGKFYENPSTAKYIQNIVKYLPDILVPKKYSGPYDGSLKIKFQYETNEGHAIWNSFCPLEDHYLDENDLSDEAVNYFRKVVKGHLEIFNKSRFVNKMPHNSMRIRYISGIFPDAKFIHIIRNPRAVINSILNRRVVENENVNDWWGVKPPNWKDYKNKNSFKQVVNQWYYTIEIINKDRKILRDDQYFEIKYEDLMDEPEMIMDEVINFAELRKSKKFKNELFQYKNKLEDKNYKSNKKFSDGEKREIKKICNKYLVNYGYVI